MRELNIEQIVGYSLANMRGRLPDYALYQAYYDGKHELAFATDKFRSAFDYLFKELAINLCPPVVRAYRNRLKVKRFDVEEGDKAVGERAWKVWNRNRMDKRSKEVHDEALTKGDTFVLVWPGADGKAVIYPQTADSIVVYYEEENPLEVAWAVKLFWTLDKHLRLNVYTRDAIYKFITKEAIHGLLPTDSTAFVTYDAEPVVENPYGQVPVFHFGNGARTGGYGKSEIKDIKAPQDALNKTVADMLVGMEYVALPQRWATGLQVEIDPATGKPKPPFEPGVDRVWAVESDEVKFGEFQQAQLEPFLKVKADFALDVARISGLPLHYLLIETANYPSGEALRTAEDNFARRIEDMQVGFGSVWEDVFKFALRVDGEKMDKAQLRVEWHDAYSVSDKERYETFQIKRNALSLPAEQVQLEAGYTEQEVAEFTKKRDEEMQKQTELGAMGKATTDKTGKTAGSVPANGPK